MFGKHKTHKWKRIEGNPIFLASGKVWVVEGCKCGKYRYVQVKRPQVYEERIYDEVTNEESYY